MTSLHSHQAISRVERQQIAALKHALLAEIGRKACGWKVLGQRTGLRLMTLVAARYDWAADHLDCGLREIATLWQVDERTVKRELAKLRDLGWISLKRPAARGRNAVHQLEASAILDIETPEPAAIETVEDTTRDIGNTRNEVVSSEMEQLESSIEESAEVIPFRSGQAIWRCLMNEMAQSHPGLHGSWLLELEARRDHDGTWVLGATSRFRAAYLTSHHLRLIRARLERHDPVLQGIEIRVIEKRSHGYARSRDFG